MAEKSSSFFIDIKKTFLACGNHILDTFCPFVGRFLTQVFLLRGATRCTRGAVPRGEHPHGWTRFPHCLFPNGVQGDANAWVPQPGWRRRCTVASLRGHHSLAWERGRAVPSAPLLLHPRSSCPLRCPRPGPPSLWPLLPAGKLEQAVECHQEAVRAAEKAASPDLQAAHSNLLGAAYLLAGVAGVRAPGVCSASPPTPENGGPDHPRPAS
jgi:hypothetical protein